MASVIRVSIQIESALVVDASDAASLADLIRVGLEPETLDGDLVLWLLGGATVRAEVST
jgi:hypothetical protein